MSSGNIDPNLVDPASLVGGTPPAPVESAPTPVGNSLKSTIMPSTQQQILDSLSASVPLIAAPLMSQLFTSPTKATGTSMDIRLAEDKAIINMLTQWLESLREQAAEMARKQHDPLLRHQINGYDAFANIINAVVSTSHHAGLGIENKDFIPLMTVGLIILGTGGVELATMNNEVSKSAHMAVTPIVNEAGAPLLNASDMRAELGLLGAMLLQGASYFANTQSVETLTGQKPGKEIEETAKNYAEVVLALVTSGQLTNLISAIVAQKTDPGKPLDKSLIKNLELQIKIMLLSTALAGLYRSAKEGGTGAITAQEFQGLLDGSVGTFGNHKDLMDKLVAQINQFYADPALAGASGESLKSAMLAFLDQNPILSTLTNPIKVFTGVLNPVPREAGDLPA